MDFVESLDWRLHIHQEVSTTSVDLDSVFRTAACFVDVHGIYMTETLHFLIIKKVNKTQNVLQEKTLNPQAHF